jgi:tetratricopeptide (TPR) repeat protein
LGLPAGTIDVMYDKRLVVAFLAAGSFVCAPVDAQVSEGAAADARPAEGNDDERARALALYEQSRERYELGDYAEAAALLRRAHAILPEANLLYNLARAYGNLGDFERAIDAYERFLEAAPESDLRETIEARIANYREVLAERREQERARERERRLALERARSESRDGPNPAPWILAGSGGGVLLAGTVLGAFSLSARNEAEDDPSFSSAKESSDRAVALGWSANGAFILGGLLTIIGVVWGIVEVAGGSDPDKERVAFDVGPGGATLSW